MGRARLGRSSSAWMRPRVRLGVVAPASRSRAGCGGGPEEAGITLMAQLPFEVNGATLGWCLKVSA